MLHTSKVVPVILHAPERSIELSCGTIFFRIVEFTILSLGCVVSLAYCCYKQSDVSRDEFAVILDIK